MSECLRIASRIHNSTKLVIIIVFVSLLTDSLLLTLVDPILPDIIRRINNNTANTVIRASDDPVASDDINNKGQYGYLVAAKGATQFICNPFVGLLVTRFGYRRPMLLGSIVLMASTMAFAFGDNYTFLFVTRMMQGASSSVTAVTGMGLLASTFSSDEDRGQAMGVAIAGISMGIIVGPVYGSVLYQFFGQAVPFLTLAGMIFVTIGLQLCGFKMDKDGKDHSLSSVLRLICDPYILIVAGNVFLLNLDVSVILAFLPLRLIDLADPDTWQLGIVVLPTSIGYLAASIIFPRLHQYVPRWLWSLLGLLISSATLGLLAFTKTFTYMLIVTTFLGLALGMVSTSMQPIFAQISDLRHSSIYGNVYAVSDMSVCLAMFLGPLAGGPIVYALGFEWMVCGIALLNLCFAQFSCLLRHLPASVPQVQTLESEEKQKLLSKPKTPRTRSFSTSHMSPVSGSWPTPRYPDYMSSMDDRRMSGRSSYLDSI